MSVHNGFTIEIPVYGEFMYLSGTCCSCCYGLILDLGPRPHPLTRRNGLVNKVEFLGLVHAISTV